MTRARDVANLIGSGNYSSTTFTATAGQTVFSIAHTQNFVQVFMNGLLLDLTVDYTSNGSAVTLTSGAAAGDEIEVVAYNTFSVGDALNQAAADTRYVNTAGDTMTGALTVGGGVTVNNGHVNIDSGYSYQWGDSHERIEQSDGKIEFFTNNGEQMTLSGSSLGIGTTAPLRQLHIHNTSANSEIAFTAGTSGVSSILFGDGQTGTDVYRGYVQYNHADDNMLFGIGAAGTMTLNTASNTFGLDFITNSSPYGVRVRANGSASSQEGLVVSDHANNLKWKATMNGSTTQIADANATSFNATSDYRLKENIEDLTDGITKVKQLQPRKYNWISDETDTLEDGFIAHEVATVVPSVVKGSKDGVVVWQEGEELPDGVSLGDNKLDDGGNTTPEYQGIDYGKLVPLLTAALQEAIAKIETLETKVAALEGG